MSAARQAFRRDFASEDALLVLSNLTLRFKGQDNDVVQDVSLRVRRGEVLCVVGESGCGKSVTSMAIMGLLPQQSTRISDGRMQIASQEWDLVTERLPAGLRGNEIAMIFQEPMTSLNPAYRIGDQIAEVVQRHRRWARSEALSHAEVMLYRVGIANPKQRLREYPHQLSGGMRQRVMIAMALANDPQILIADEPTTALDVTIQTQILDLIGTLRDETGMGTIMITHDLGVVAEIADTVAAMYGGQVVEQGPVEEVFRSPQHPYTIGLMSAMPRLDRPGDRLVIVPGTVPTISKMPDGCRFRTRCAFATSRCRTRPQPTGVAPDHDVACHYVPLEQHVKVSA